MRVIRTPIESQWKNFRISYRSEVRLDAGDAGQAQWQPCGSLTIDLVDSALRRRRELDTENSGQLNGEQGAGSKRCAGAYLGASSRVNEGSHKHWRASLRPIR